MQTFTNSTVEIESLPKYEATQLSIPDARYWNVILINSILFLGFLLLGLLAIIFLTEDGLDDWLYWVVGYITLGAILLLVFRASFKRRGYALREKDILFKSGIIAETTTIVPLNRIQHVSLTEGVFSRMFGLGTVQVFTASGTSGDISIAGIDIEQAKRIKETLITRLVNNQH